MRQPSAAFGSILVSLLAASCLPVAFFLPSGEGEEGFGRLYLYLYAASIFVGFLVLVWIVLLVLSIWRHENVWWPFVLGFFPLLIASVLSLNLWIQF